MKKKSAGNQPLIAVKEKQRIEKTCIQPPLNYPWFLIQTEQGKSCNICCTTSPPYLGFSTKSPYDFNDVCVFNCCYGWLILSDSNQKYFHLWNPVTSKLINLAPLEFELGNTVYYAVLLSPGNSRDNLDPNCMILLFHEDSVIYYCTLEGNCWNSINYGNELDKLRLCHPIVVNDMVYAEQSTNLVSINHVNDTGIDTTVCCHLPVPLQGENDWRIVESSGELFQISIFWQGEDLEFDKEISSVEVFKLDLVSMSWNQVTEIHDRDFFITDDYAVSSRRENTGGFLYYINFLFVHSYSFADNSVSTSLVYTLWNIPISPLSSFPKPILYLADTRFVDGPVVPMNLVETGRQYKTDTRKFRKKTNVCKIKVEKNNEGEESLLINLPDDLIYFITVFLNPVDYLNFRSVSKTCKRLAPQIVWREALGHLAYASPLSPWLMWSDNLSNVYNFMDSELDGKYLINIPKPLLGSKIVHAKNGWLLLMLESWKTLSFYNPLTTEIINLPEFPVDLFVDVPTIAFSEAPSSSKCVVIAIDHYSSDETDVCIFQVGKKEWDVLAFDNGSSSKMTTPLYCPVFHDGAFYVFGYNGSLEFFNVLGDEDISNGSLQYFDVLDDEDISKVDCGIIKECFSGQTFILECGGKLLLVSVRDFGESINIFFLNKTTFTWEKTDNLGNQTLYLCRSLSFSTPAKANWMRNIIFFPKLKHDSIVYYSTDTKEYHSLADKHGYKDYKDTKDLTLAVWIEPSVGRGYRSPFNE